MCFGSENKHKFNWKGVFAHPRAHAPAFGLTAEILKPLGTFAILRIFHKGKPQHTTSDVCLCA